MNHLILILCVLLAVVVRINDGTLSQSDRKKKSSKKQQQQAGSPAVQGPVDQTVYERGLVTTDLKSPWDVIRNYAGYSKDTTLRNFDGHVLGYVTPWNNAGYDAAKTFGKKFSSVSPVWLQIVPQPGNQEHPYVVMGTHDVDKKWLQDVRKASPDVKIIPRVLFDKWSADDYVRLFSDAWRVDAIAKLLTGTVVAKHGFDGVVLEVWSQLGGQAKPQITAVVERLGKAVRSREKTFVLVIPPPVYAGDVRGMFDAQDLDNLADSVDYFSLMTYDYSSPQRPGPNAHMEWIRKCLKLLDPDQYHADKILLGLNFYGYDFTAAGGGPILGRDFVQLLKEAADLKEVPSFKWDERSQEHFIEFKVENRRKHTVFFPSLNSIQSRLLLAKEMNLGGVAIWELGQGLDYFF